MKFFFIFFNFPPRFYFNRLNNRVDFFPEMAINKPQTTKVTVKFKNVKKRGILTPVRPAARQTPFCQRKA